MTKQQEREAIVEAMKKYEGRVISCPKAWAKGAKK